MVDDRTALMTAHALNSGYEILWYTIDRVLGQGGFGITYLAHDRNLDRTVAIKEYLPTSFAFRREDYSVKPITGEQKENFLWGLNSFQKEAQTLARFDHPNIVKVHTVFERNNTAYMVMEYEHGQNLSRFYQNNNNLDQQFFEQVFFPIFDGLKEIHKFDFIHRDIKPANIYIRENGTPVLIDFGSARETTQQQSSDITTLVSHGYTPLEQYDAYHGNQGPWTDIYALAATIYQGIVGNKPAESLRRSACLLSKRPDLLERLDTDAYPAFSASFLDAVSIGLKLEPAQRPQSIEHWNRMFTAVQLDGALDSEKIIMRPPSTFTEPDIGNSKPLSNSGSTNELGVLATQQFATNQHDTLGRTNYHSERGSELDSESDTYSRCTRIAPDTDHPSNDEPFDFDDRRFEEAETARRRELHSRQQPKKTRHRKAKRHRRTLAAILALFVLGVGGGYLFLQSDKASTSNGISAASLSTMPRPSPAIATTLPKDSALSQLNEMSRLAPLLNHAYSIDSTDPYLLNTIRQIESSLLRLAKTWNAIRFPDIASRIVAVSNALPAAMHDRNMISGSLAEVEQVSVYNRTMALLDDKRYLRPSGDSVLDMVLRLNTNEYQQLRGTSQWQKMISEISQNALDKLARSEFDDVARLTEAALSLDAENSGFNELSEFLAGS